MNTPEFILQSVFFIVNIFALCFIVWFVILTVRRIERKMDETMNFMRFVKTRHDSTYLYTLYGLQNILVKEERYEEADRVNKVIEEELKHMNENDKKDIDKAAKKQLKGIVMNTTVILGYSLTNLN